MNEFSIPLSAAGQARVASNPYARSVDEIAQEAERRRQREAVLRATDNPDQAAEARRIAQQAGVPAPLVQQRLPDYRADQRRAEVAQAARDPRVGPWLAQNAEVAGDDIATLINLGDAGEKFRLGQEATRSRFTRREAIDANFRPQELNQITRDILRASSRSRAEYRELVADAVMAKRAPATAAAMARQDDERDRQAKMQRGPLAQVGGSLTAGAFSFTGGMFGLGANLAGLVGLDDLESGGLLVQGLADKKAASVRGRSTNFITDSLLTGIESVPVGLGTVVTGSAKVGLGLFFAQTSGNSYAEARGHGLGVLRSTLYGTTQGGIEVATEAIPAKALGDIARGNGAVSGALKRFFLGDVLGEQAATVLQDANTWVTLNPDKTLSDFIAERPEAAARTFFATLSGSGGQAAVTYGLHRAFRTERQIMESEGQLSQLDQIMRLAADSRTRGRDPQAFRDLIEQVGGDERLFVPGEVIAQFNQSYREDPFWRDYADEIDEAVATGGEVSIPLADVAARLAGTPDWDAVGASARIGAEGMSRAEIDEANALVGTLDMEAAEAVDAQVRAEKRAAAPGVKLRENIRGQLMNAGMTPDVASQNAEIVAALFETEAANLGRKITGDEFGEAISVQRELPGLIGPSQPLEQMDIVVNAMRAGGDVEVGVGPSLLQFIGQYGGINDTGGDLKSMGFPKRLIRDFDPAQAAMLGLSGAGEYGIDNVYRAAISAGYFPDLAAVDQAEGVDTLDTNDFLAAIADELAGRKLFSQTREEVYRRAGAELRQILDAAGVDADTASMDEIWAAVALFEEGQTFDQSAVDRGGRSVLPSLNADVLLEPVTLENLSAVATREEARAAVPRGTFESADGLGVRITESTPRKWFAGNANPVKRSLAPHIVAIFQQSVTYGRIGEFAYSIAHLRLDGADVAVRFAVRTQEGGRLYQVEGVEVAPISGRQSPVQGARGPAREYSVADLVGEFNRMQQGDYPLFQGGSDTPNAQIQFTDALAIIRLFESANLTSFQHEMAHFWLERFKGNALAAKSAETLGNPVSAKPLTGDDLRAAQIDVLGRLRGEGFNLESAVLAREEAADMEAALGAERAAVLRAADTFAAVTEADIQAVEDFRSAKARYVSIVQTRKQVEGNEAAERALASDIAENAAAGFPPVPEDATFDDNAAIREWYQARVAPTAQPGNPAAAQTVQDWETLKAWFAENGHAVGEDNVIPVEAHELFARSWERYLMEGKAPKTSLQSVFRKVASWFKSIYRSVKALNAPITPEIREVMDRMLATEEEIAAAAQDRAMMLMFDDAIAAGMTEAEAARYKALGEEARNEAEEELYGKVMRSIRARETKAWKEQERVIRMDVQDMIENRPVFAALDMLRSEYRLDRDWIVNTYGEDALKLLPAGVPPIYREGGDNADQIAEMVGFKSGDEMVRELMGLERLRQQLKASGDKRSVKKATIDQEVAEEMHRRFGDPLTDGSIEREAAAAIQNERQGERIEMELRALASKAGRRPTPYALAREWAKDRIARGVVAETVSGDAQYRYQRTATKAAKAATAAFIKGDTAEAFKQKQIEMLHNALAREAAEQGDRIERAVKRMGKLARQRTVKSLAQDYLDQIHGLLENYEFKQASQRQINARDAYARWAAEQTAAGKDVVAVERLAQAKNWSRMTVEELLALDDAVKGLVHLGKLKRTLLDNKARRDLDALVGEAVSTMASLPQKERRPMDGGTGWLQAIRHGFLSFNAALRKMEDVFDRLDAKNPRGVFNRVVMMPLVEAQAAERELLDTKIAEVVAAMKEVPKESLKRWQEKRTIDELAAMDEQGRPLAEPATMLGEELIAMALNMGNRGNMEKLIVGRGWDKQHGSIDAARAVVLDVLNRELTPADWQYVQRVWDIVDSLWPELSAMEKRVNGFAPDKVEAASLQTSAGELRGGYFPVVYDPRSRVGARNLEVEENGLFPSSYYRATTKAGSTRERTEFKGPLHLSLGVLNRHLAEVVHDITHREAIINADKFLSDPRVQQAVIDVVGPELQQQFRPWLQHIANEWAADREANTQAERMMKGLRTNATMVGLGFRISTIMLQVSGYANSIERIGLTAVARGIIKARWSPEAWNFALDNSKELRSRMATMDRDIRDNARRLASKQAGVLDAAQQFAFHGIGYMDRLVTVATWHGAYDKALSEGMDHDDAVFVADKAVRQSQGSGAAKDMARVQRGTGKMGEAWKLSTMFYSYSNAYYQRQAAFWNDAADAVRERDLSAVPDLAARFLWLNIVPALASAWLSGNGPGDDEDEAAWALAKVLTAQFQGIPIARGIAGSLDTGFGYSFTPAEGFGRSTVNLLKDVQTVAEGGDTKRMTRNFLETFGYATGKVPGQLATSTQFLVDVGYGEQDPQTAAEWWRGLTKGKTEPAK